MSNWRKKLMWGVLYLALALGIAAVLLPAATPDCPQFRQFSVCD